MISQIFRFTREIDTKVVIKFDIWVFFVPIKLNAVDSSSDYGSSIYSAVSTIEEITVFLSYISINSILKTT